MSSRVLGLVLGLVFLIAVGSYAYVRFLAGPSAELVAQSIQSAVAEARAVTPAGELNLAAATDFAWDELFVFGPYTTVDMVEGALGVRLSESALARIHERDDIVLLVFRREGRVLVQVPYLRSEGDFASSGGLQAIARQAARFELIPLASDPSWVNLSLTVSG